MILIDLLSFEKHRAPKGSEELLVRFRIIHLSLIKLHASTYQKLCGTTRAYGDTNAKLKVV